MSGDKFREMRSDLRRYHQSVGVLHWLQRQGAKFTVDEDGVATVEICESDDELRWLVDSIMDRVGADASNRFCREQHRRRREERLAQYVGGPNDGEPLTALGHYLSPGVKVYPVNIKRAWWAVYLSRSGQIGADFIGYATSKAKAKKLNLARNVTGQPISLEANEEQKLR